MTLPLSDINTEANTQTGETMLSPAILEILASRICHDLISPVGAVHNGVEFLQEMGADAGDEAIALITHSAQQASARLQAFRLAYGAGGRDPNIKPEDIYKTFGNLIQNDRKITQDWDPHSDIGFTERPSGYCKTLMGALMLAEECLPKGGTVRVKRGDNDLETAVVAEGNDVLLRPQIAHALNGNIAIDEMDPRLVHPYALSVIARHYGLSIEISSQNSARVTLLIKQM